MAGILDGVDQRTQMAGQNRLELLLFSLGTKQRFGINVFKVQEVIQCPPLTHMPHSHPSVRGVANMRGKTIPVLDLAMAIGQEPAEAGDEGRFVIITEYNRAVQGFLVDSVDKIVNMEWKDILPPPKGTGGNTYMTAVTNVDDELVEIIDVEKVISEIHEVDTSVSESMVAEANISGEFPRRILVADDSSVARNQIKRTIEQLGMEVILANDGKQGLDKLRAMAEEGGDIQDQILLVISDIEMPEMDGYTLTTEIRKDERLKNLHIILHTSLSGVFNETLVKKVGANRFVAKFSADELSGSVIDYIKSIGGEI